MSIEYNEYLPDSKETIYHDKIWKLMNEKGLNHIFGNKQSRLATSLVTYTFVEDNILIGFAYITPEKYTAYNNDNNVLFLDVGIIEDYQNKGYGRIIFEKLGEFLGTFNNTYIIAETSSSNIGANKIMEEKGQILFNINEANYYLFPKENYNNFLESGEKEQLFQYVYKNMAEQIQKQKVKEKSL